jgi:bisphosphoglycerate-dependent phosphoglycerate mutase family 1
LHSQVRRLLILRHGQSEWNAEGRWQGWIDVPLTEVGEAQARARGEALAADGVDVTTVFASDLQRARRTAELVAETIGGAIVVDERLRERHGGDWQGHTAAEIDELWPGAREQWRRRELPSPPGAESDEAVLTRFDAALADVINATDSASEAVIVTHGGMLRLVAGRAGVTAANVVENVGGHWFRWDGARLVPDDPLPSLRTDGVTALE